LYRLIKRGHDRRVVKRLRLHVLWCFLRKTTIEPQPKPDRVRGIINTIEDDFVG